MEDFFKWSDKFSVFHEDMDKDHQRFLQHLNFLYKHLGNPNGAVIFDLTMLELETYAREHFRDEECFLANIGYPGLDQQVAQHNFFKKELSYLRLSAKQGTAKDLKSALEFMRDWFLRHIVEFDKNYADWLQERPVH
jgi:hemerythrin